MRGLLLELIVRLQGTYLMLEDFSSLKVSYLAFKLTGLRFSSFLRKLWKRLKQDLEPFYELAKAIHPRKRLFLGKSFAFQRFLVARILPLWVIGTRLLWLRSYGILVISLTICGLNGFPSITSILKTSNLLMSLETGLICLRRQCTVGI